MDRIWQRRLAAGLPIAAGLVMAGGIALYYVLGPTADQATCETDLHDAGLAACSRAIESGDFKGDKLVALYKRRGFIYFLKDYDRAIADFTEVIRLDPKDARAYINRGVSYREKGDAERAIADFSEAIQLDPKEPLSHANRCWARAVVGRELAQALADCDEALRLKPGETSTLALRGLVRLRLDRVDDALADFDAALKINPAMPVALYGRGMARLKAGDSAAGDADIAAAKKAEADVAQTIAHYGSTP